MTAGSSRTQPAPAGSTGAAATTPAPVDPVALLEEIMGNLKAASTNAMELIRRAIKRIAAQPAELENCPASQALRLAIWSDKDRIDREEVAQTFPIVGALFPGSESACGDTPLMRPSNCEYWGRSKCCCWARPWLMAAPDPPVELRIPIILPATTNPPRGFMSAIPQWPWKSSPWRCGCKSLHEWGKSADVYQEILEKYPDRVVPLQVPAAERECGTAISLGGDDGPGVIVQVAGGWIECLPWPLRTGGGGSSWHRAWPGELEAACTRFAPLYFVTESGKAASLRLMDVYIELGEFPAAAWIGDRLLQWHPNLIAERPESALPLRTGAPPVR